MPKCEECEKNVYSVRKTNSAGKWLCEDCDHVIIPTRLINKRHGDINGIMKDEHGNEFAYSYKKPGKKIPLEETPYDRRNKDEFAWKYAGKKKPKKYYIY